MENHSPDQARLERTRRLAHWLDSQFSVGGISVGWDPILGLFPGVGDSVSSFLSSYILVEAARAGVSTPVILRMAGNVAVETVLGLVPFVGDAFDVMWKANKKNVALFEKAVAAPRSTEKRSALLLAGIGLGLLLLCLSPLFLLLLLIF